MKLRTLSINGRIRLVEDLWDSIAADQVALPMTDEQWVEIDRRVNAYESDKIKGREVEEGIADTKKHV